MSTNETISQLVEMANNTKTSDESRMVVSFSVSRPGVQAGPSPDQLSERMRMSVAQMAGQDDCVLGVQQGFRVADDSNIVHYAIGEFLGGKIVKIF